ncbi:MAG: aminotransferase class III-fold pyridoxal phosphate-dependent enzyme [Candidatus Accumulibacter sp.]|nr:aminotransferase class III-fold pyridoxal phosphate-dependent enzyme [Accumulibacter sp.]
MTHSKPRTAPSTRYAASEKFLQRAERVIPLGSQTFSKSRTQFPLGVSPLFADRGEGAYLYDIDNNRYLDFICSLGAITLGHADPDMTAAVVKQLGLGVVFSLPSRLEAEVAERIVDRVPCAEMVRFGKNGSDATAGAIRLARAFTGRERVAVCGYHGWQDWYIGATSRHLGVPESTRALTHTIAYNDVAALDALFNEYPGEFSALIMEPMNFVDPRPGYLSEVKSCCHKHGALLIFDEVVTGFRYAPGTAQELLGVTPDLVTLGKGLANGFPLSAIAGRADVMKLMEEVFFSFTMGGETLSLASARACLDKQYEKDTLNAIERLGDRLKADVGERIRTHGLEGILSIVGHPSWTLIGFADRPGATAFELKTLYMQECFRRGILSFGVHFISYAMTEADIDFALAAYDEIFPILAAAVETGDCRRFLECEPLVPLFKVR